MRPKLRRTVPEPEPEPPTRSRRPLPDVRLLEDVDELLDQARGCLDPKGYQNLPAAAAYAVLAIAVMLRRRISD